MSIHSKIEPLYPRKGWNLKILLLCHLAIAFLLGTFFWPETRVYWDKLDLACFQFLNGTLEGHRTWQVFWALANHKNADWVEDVVILGFFMTYIRAAHKSFRPRRIAELIFFILYTAAIIYFVNKTIFRETLDIHRASPTLVVDSCFRLSEAIPWLEIKDYATRSFPGDHATTAILFAANIFYFAGWRMGAVASLYALLLCLPRLFTGAHWFSDIFIGSGCIIIFCLSWAFCTPLYSLFISLLEKPFSRKRAV